MHSVQRTKIYAVNMESLKCLTFSDFAKTLKSAKTICITVFAYKFPGQVACDVLFILKSFKVHI